MSSSKLSSSSKLKHFATKISEVVDEIEEHLTEEEIGETDEDTYEEVISYLRLAIDQLKYGER